MELTSCLLDGVKQLIRAGHEEHKQIWTPDTIIYEAIESDFQIPGGVQPCVEINQCAGCTRQFFTKSFLGDDMAALAPSSGEEPTSPRH